MHIPQIQRPFYMAHPFTTVLTVYTLSAAIGMILALNTPICNPYAGQDLDYDPTDGPNEPQSKRWQRGRCIIGLALALPILVTSVIVCIVEVALRRFTRVLRDDPQERELLI